MLGEIAALDLVTTRAAAAAAERGGGVRCLCSDLGTTYYSTTQRRLCKVAVPMMMAGDDKLFLSPDGVLAARGVGCWDENGGCWRCFLPLQLLQLPPLSFPPPSNPPSCMPPAKQTRGWDGVGWRRRGGAIGVGRYFHPAPFFADRSSRNLLVRWRVTICH